MSDAALSNPRLNCTSKQFGDIGENWVLAMLGFAGVPTVKMPDGWPGFDLTAYPVDRPPTTISVKTNSMGTLGGGKVKQSLGDWDWTAIVLVDHGKPRVWVLPRAVFIAHASSGSPPQLHYRELFGPLACYENNLTLREVMDHHTPGISVLRPEAQAERSR